MICLIGLLIHPFECNSQTKQNPAKSANLFSKAIEAYQQNLYIKAEKYLLDAIKADTGNVNTYLLLSDVSDELKNSVQRTRALQQVVKLDSLNHPLAFKLLAEIYFEQGNFQNSLQMWKAYQRFNLANELMKVSQMIDKCQYAIQLMSEPIPVEIIHLDSSVNTDENEYWPLISTDDSTLYFTRLITGQKQFAYERLFYASRIDSTWGPADQLSFGYDEMVNEGTISLTADGNLMFFSACGRPGGKGSCDIYYLQKTDGKWSLPKNAGAVLNSVFWEAQPAVSALGERLFFSSNREGGFGKKDIWVSEITKTERGQLTFSVPLNLGTKVNTSENDFSPFIHADDQTLYFASDGRYGLGKSDLYLTRYTDSIWTEAIHLGYPVNSPEYEDGLVVSPTAHVAVFSSNRTPSVNGSKDLFQLVLPQQFQPQKMGYVKGFVFDAVSKNKINAEIRIINLEEQRINELQASVENGYVVTLKENQTYAFHISKPGYLFYSSHFNLKDPKQFNHATVLNIYLQPIQNDVAVILKNIFFEHDSYQMKETSYPELNELIHFLKINPTVSVEISGHTDNTGTPEYNLKLSEKRALEIGSYLMKSIRPERITLNGYGAEKPVDTNDTEQGRSNNRRSELRITGK